MLKEAKPRGTSKKFELKLVGVARASLEDLLLDYEDFLRQRGMVLWNKDDSTARTIRGVAYQKNRTYMTYKTNTPNFAPEGWHTVTPRIVAHDARQFVDFLRQVFGATGDYQPDRPSVVVIGDSMVMISDAGIRNPMTAFLYIYVDDTDAAYLRALDAGVRSLEAPFDTPYGDRRCMVEDRWGNTWQIATHTE